MIPVGEKLGGRYFVVKAQDREEPGLVFEVRDALSNVFHAQLLYKSPLQGTDLDILRRELASLGKTPLLITPDEIVATSQGVPCAIFKQPLPPPLADDLTPMAGMGSPEKKLQQQKALLASFAALADELGRAAGSRTGHGAIALAHVGAEGKGDARKCVLSGFGIEAAARLAEKKPRPAPKADPSGLFLTLHEALDKVSSVPEGGVAARWTVLRNCARAGDHPALTSCGALAKFLRDALTELEQNPVKAAPPPPAAKEAPASADQSRKTPAQRESKPAPKPAKGLDQLREWAKNNDRTAKVGGGALGVVLLGAVLYVSLSEDEGAVQTPPADTTAATSGADGGARGGPGQRGACGRESVTAPVTIELVGVPDHVDAVCTRERQTLRVFGRSAGSWVTGERGVRRGSQFDHGPTTLTETLREPGVAFANATAAWTVWRAAPSSSTPTPSAFTVTRLDDVPQPLVLQTAGLDETPFRGAWLLKVDDQGAWIASTVARAEGPVAVVIRLAQSTARVEAPLTVYRLADASVESAIASDPPVLLLRTSEGTRHSFTTAQVPLTSLAVISSAMTGADGGAGGDAGAAFPMREVPAVALQRSEAWQVEGAAAVAASEGYGSATTDRHFVVTVSTATTDARCTGVWCLAEGAASLVTWPARGGPVARTLSQHGRGESVSQGANGAVVALVAEEDGARQVAHTLSGGGDGGGAVTTEMVAVRGVRRAKLVFCGTEPWVVYGAMTPEPRLGALPLACVSRR